MTKVAVWCRHDGDNIIGIGSEIPWHIKSDFQRFRRITTGQNVVAGQSTYESFPNRTLPDRNIYILSFETDYQVTDPEHHFVVNDVNFFKDFEQDIYVSGGASIYKLFMTGGPKLMPDIVVDLNQKYKQIFPDFDLDNITTRVMVRKGEFVEQSVLKRIILAITNV